MGDNETVQAKTWRYLFRDFNFRDMQKACLELVSTVRFFPVASEVIEAYKAVVKREEAAAAARAAVPALPGPAVRCYLCDNFGLVGFDNGGYEFWARCVCPRGRDRSRFSAPEIDRAALAMDGNGNRSQPNRIYIPDIREALGETDFVILDGERKAAYLARRAEAGEDLDAVIRRLKRAWEMPSPARDGADRGADRVPGEFITSTEAADGGEIEIFDGRHCEERQDAATVGK